MLIFLVDRVLKTGFRKFVAACLLLYIYHSYPNSEWISVVVCMMFGYYIAFDHLKYHKKIKEEAFEEHLREPPQV
jgi:hypothetical protein